MAKTGQKKKQRKKITGRKTRVKKSAPSKQSAKKKSQTKKAATRKRTAAKSKKRGSTTSRKTWWGWLLRGGLIVLVLGGVFVAGYGLILDYQIKGTFAGQPWKKPARVYARAVELYEGKHLSADELETHLRQLGYAQVSSPGNGGEFIRTGNKMRFITRATSTGSRATQSVAVEIGFAGSTVQRLRDGRNDLLPIVQLDPLLIGSIIPKSGEDRMVVGADEVPGVLKDALVAVEDRSFYSHFGLDPKGILRAAFTNLRAGQVEQGGSTISQQLIKSHFLSNERSWRRKFKEALMAIGLDARMHKDEILLAYINEIYLGQDGNRAIHGFDLAGRFYFGRPLRDLELHHIATLVGMVRGPSLYNPGRHPQRAVERRNQVLTVLEQQQVISAEAADSARRQSLGLVHQGNHNNGNYPAFMSVVKEQLSRDYQSDDLSSNGLSVFTTLDVLLQNRIERALQQSVANLEASVKLKKGTLQSSAVVVAPDTGELIAIIGGRNPGFDGFNRAVNLRRPVGSLIKPFVYLSAFESGRYDSNTLISNAPMTVELDNGETWEPSNFNDQYGGDEPLYKAFADSLNVPAVRVGMDVGVVQVLDTLARLGFTRKIPAFPSVLLGAVEMSPLEVAQLYTGLAGQGFVSTTRAVRSVDDENGQALRAYPLEVSQRVKEHAVYQTIEMLKLVVSHGTGRGVNRSLPASLHIAGKTGSSNDLRDSWFAGFSGDAVAVVWVGNDDNQPTGLTGSRGALPVWTSIMAPVAQRAVETLLPKSLQQVSVDYATGQSARTCEGSVLIPLRPESLTADAVRCANP